MLITLHIVYICKEYAKCKIPGESIYKSKIYINMVKAIIFNTLTSSKTANNPTATKESHISAYR